MANHKRGPQPQNSVRLIELRNLPILTRPVPVIDAQSGFVLTPGSKRQVVELRWSLDPDGNSIPNSI